MSIEATEQLAEELKLIENTLPPNDSATRRIAVRSMFASIEALVSAIMSSTVRQFPQPSKQASHEERHKYFLEMCALSDISYDVDDNGDLTIQSPRMRFKSRVLFAIKMRAKSTAVNLNPKQISGWDDFLKAIKIRNRVTHPQSNDDIAVSEEDYRVAVKGFQWVVQCNHRACGGTRF